MLSHLVCLGVHFRLVVLVCQVFRAHPVGPGVLTRLARHASQVIPVALVVLSRPVYPVCHRLLWDPALLAVQVILV